MSYPSQPRRPVLEHVVRQEQARAKEVSSVQGVKLTGYDEHDRYSRYEEVYSEYSKNWWATVQSATPRPALSCFEPK